MNSYYLHDGKDQLGPFSLDELKSLNPSPNANIWHKGMDGWKQAKDIEELQSLFEMPPPFNPAKENVRKEVEGPPVFIVPKEQTIVQPRNEYPFPEKTKSRKGLWIGLAIGVLALIGVLGYNMQNSSSSINTDSNSSSNYSEPAASSKTPEQLRRELLQKERNDFTTYLAFKKSTTLQPNMVVTQTGSFWRKEKKEQQGYMLHALVSNNATMANYKDLVCTITYQTQTRTPIKSESFTIYKYFQRGQVTVFDMLVHPPVEMQFFDVEVSGAKAVN